MEVNEAENYSRAPGAVREDGVRIPENPTSRTKLLISD